MASGTWKNKEIIVVDEASSTNALLMEMARAGIEHGTALRARRQHAGRGQRDHIWDSPDGGIYLSLLVRPDIPASQLTGLPVICGIGALDALTDCGVQDLALKWPNDLLCNGRKLGGILVEADLASGSTAAVCGIGINYQKPPLENRPPNSLPVTGLACCLSKCATPPSPDALATIVRDHVLQATEAWLDHLAHRGPAAPPLSGIQDVYNQVLAFRRQRVNLLTEGEIVASGTLVGIDPWGRAIIQNQDGTTTPFDASRVSLRPA